MSKSDLASSVNFFNPENEGHSAALKAIGEEENIVSPALSVVEDDNGNAPQYQQNYNPVSAMMSAIAASFGAVVMPAGYERLIADNERNGDFSSNNGGGAITEVNGIIVKGKGKNKDEDEESEENVERFKDAFENSDLTKVDKNGVLKDWDKRSFNLGDTTISSKGWDTLMSIMRDPRRRKEALDKIAKEHGWTEEERNEAETDLIEAAEIMWRIKHGQGTQEDIRRLEEIGRNNPNTIVAARDLERDNSRTQAIEMSPVSAPVQTLTENYNTQALGTINRDLTSPTNPYPTKIVSSLSADIPTANNSTPVGPMLGQTL